MPPVAIVDFNLENDCPDIKKPIPITLSPFEEITICLKFTFKFLKPTRLFYIRYFSEKNSKNSTLLGIYFKNFETKYGFLKYNGINYLFQWSNHNIKPDVWQKICISITNLQIYIVMNGEKISNETISITNNMNKEITSANLWLGSDNIRKFGSNGLGYFVFEGSISNVYLWSQHLKISELISITNSCSLIHTPKPDLLTWNYYVNSLVSPCLEYHYKNEEFCKGVIPSRIHIIENKTNFDNANYLCQAYGANFRFQKIKLKLHFWHHS